MPNLKPPSAAALRGSRPVQTAIKIRREEARAADEPCWLCGQAIDYSLLDTKERDHDGYPEMDHVLPLSKFPQYAADLGNLKPSHRLCNNERSDKMTASGLGVSSQDWESMGE